MSGERITEVQVAGWLSEDLNSLSKSDLLDVYAYVRRYKIAKGGFKDPKEQIKALKSQLSKVTEERDRVADLIERLAQWKNAYPKSVFPPVDLDGIAEREGVPIDYISAQVLRVATIGWSDEAERLLSSLTENKS